MCILFISLRIFIRIEEFVCNEGTIINTILEQLTFVESSGDMDQVSS